MKKILYSLIVVTIISIGFLPSHAFAINTLQLDVEGGTYDPLTETIIAPSNSFILYALLKPDTKNELSDWYYISAALVPKVDPPGGSLGSFTFNGDIIDVTNEMTFGTPPIDIIATQLFDSKDLAPHEIFDTYFSEFKFQFSGTNKINEYNTQDRAISGNSIDLTYDPDTPGGEIYYAAFSVNTTNLAPGYLLHFDLYNTKVCNRDQGSCDVIGDVDQTQFAPFSHDAESRIVPEPATLILLGLGFLGLALWRSKTG